MIGVFTSNKHEQLKKELLKENIDESKINKIIASGVDINQKDAKGRTLLFALVQKRKTDSMKILFKHKADVNIEDNYGKTVFDEAIYKEDTLLIRYILEHGASLSRINSSGRTIVQDVALEGNIRTFKILLKYNPDLNLKDNYGKTTLFDAVEGGNLDIVKEVVNNIEDINLIDNDGKTVLFYSILKKNVLISKYLIASGININIQDKDKQNVMFNAVLLGHKNIEIIELLIDYGINLNEKDKFSKTLSDEILKILELLSNIKLDKNEYTDKYKNIFKSNDYLSLTRVLVDSGLDIDKLDDTGLSTFAKEVEKKNYPVLDFLIAAGANINVKDNNGRTVLFDLVLKGPKHQEMIDYLMDNNIEIDELDNQERSIIDELVEVILVKHSSKRPSSRRLTKVDPEGDYYSLLKYFLIFKPNINYQKSNGQSLIYDFITYNDTKLISMFFNAGIDANIVDKEKHTPLSVLIENGLKVNTVSEREMFLTKISFFLKFRVNADTPDKDGRTVYHKAVIADDLEVVERLLKKKINLNLKDKQGRTALHHTQWKGNYKIAKLLITAGANMDISDYAGFSLLNYAAILGHTQLIVTLLTSGVLMYNNNKKSKVVAKYFKDREKNLNKLLDLSITDTKMKESIRQVVENLKSEIDNALIP
ncbi:MAG: ankyrin repeat domain-containing protein [Campylobacteraceae bacterium]|nr:ankyrin repeat domain-containing protein [Campylobacteraceae bacterium]